MKRSGSSILQFTQRIPADLLVRMIGMKIVVPVGTETVSITITDKMNAIRFSLRTRVPSEAKVRQAEAAAYLETVFQAVRTNTPITLTHRQATALAGQFYRSWASGAGRERVIAMIHTPDGFVRDYGHEEESDDAHFESGVDNVERLLKSGEDEQEKAVGAITDRLLLSQGIAEVDAQSRSILIQAFLLALRDAFQSRQRNAAGDYSPDPKSERFPVWENPRDLITQTPSAKLSLLQLVEDWWRESKAAGMKPRTYESYRNTMKKFVEFVGYDDATRVTPQDVVAFKDYRLSTPHPRTGKPASARTVKDADLAGLKSVFNWAVRNKKLPSNPASGITIKFGKLASNRSRGFSETEAKAILTASLLLERGKDRAETYGAKKWVPWILAYTGARVGEIAQLRKEDVQKNEDHWIIHITPEAGTVKSNKDRKVPLHPHLIQLGLVEFVQAAPKGHLFLRPSKGGDVLGPLTGC